ncbi:tetratricopeptide repeat protein [Candidatus Gottesmanbacteria bacterium]|nr:tetratricopeptide repeat protein [Candidatus Gottesmanbacteria bacterium]
MKFKFPYFPRLNSARVIFSLEMTVLWLGLATLIAVNILAIQKSRPTHWNKLMMLFEAPFLPSRYVDLASLLWKQGEQQEARMLMASAQTLTKTNQIGASGQMTNVLGVSSDPQAVLTQWEHEVDQLKEQYAFWQSVTAEKPDYRDAFIQLATLAYQLGNLDAARASLARAQALDPNSPTVQEFTKLLE